MAWEEDFDVYSNWAGSIKDAWELFEEIGYGSTIANYNFHQRGYNKISVYEVVIPIKHGEDGWATETIGEFGSTAPEAICRAWIKSKESKSKLNK